MLSKRSTDNAYAVEPIIYHIECLAAMELFNNSPIELNC